jgi:hypothetical protein
MTSTTIDDADVARAETGLITADMTITAILIAMLSNSRIVRRAR